jgi:glutathione S-transferase
MRVMFNIADQYILNPLFELFEQIDPKVRDAKVVDEQLTRLAKGLKGLEHFIVPGKYAMGANASLADCALVPSLFFAAGIGPMLGQPDLLTATPKVKSYWAAVQADPSVAKVIGEMTKALSEFMSRGQ